MIEVKTYGVKVITELLQRVVVSAHVTGSVDSRRKNIMGRNEQESIGGVEEASDEQLFRGGNDPASTLQLLFRGLKGERELKSGKHSNCGGPLGPLNRPINSPPIRGRWIDLVIMILAKGEHRKQRIGGVIQKRNSAKPKGV